MLQTRYCEQYELNVPTLRMGVKDNLMGFDLTHHAIYHIFYTHSSCIASIRLQ